jgi:ribosome modulation factor
MCLAMDEQAWSRGFEDGRQVKPLDNCPYGLGTDERWSWISGYIEGKAARNGYTALELFHGKNRPPLFGYPPQLRSQPRNSEGM